MGKQEVATGTWKEEPYEPTIIMGVSIWIFLTMLYYLLVAVFTIILINQNIPSMTKVLMSIVSFGTGLNWVALTVVIEKERRFKQ